MPFGRFLVAAAAAFTLLACTTPPARSTPDTPAVPAAAPATATAPAPAAHPASATAATPSTAAADPRRAGLLREARSQGYRPRQQNGETMYCRNETPMGSRLEKLVCRTEDQLVDDIRNGSDAQQQLMRGRSCSGPGCGAN